MAATARAAKPPAKTTARAPARASKPSGTASSVGVVKPAAPASGAGGAAAVPAVSLKNAKAAKDLRFQATIERLNKSATTARSHAPAGQKAAEAQAASQPPANEKLAGANADKADKMGAAETAKPNANSFLSILRAEIQKAMPKKTEDAKDFMKGDDRDKLKGAMTGNVQQQQAEATGGIKAASDSPPDTASVPGKEVTPLPGEGAPPTLPQVNAAEAMPAPKGTQETSLDQGKQDTSKLMSDAQLSTPQLEKANDPRFSAVVTAKSKADRFADSAPGKYKSDEQKLLGQAGAQATGDEKKGLAGFLAQGVKALKAVRGGQLTAKQKDEIERKKVTDHIQSIFDRTKANVDKKLASLDDEVSHMFDVGSDAAVAKMKDYVQTRFDDRYSGISGGALWLKDKLLPLPNSVKAWFDEAHKVFVQELDDLVVRVAALVEGRLQEAKDEIAKGQKDIRDYVQGLPANLQTVGKTAEKEMQGRFDELRQGVEDKKSDLAQKLAQRYKDASEKGDKALQDMKDAHKSLYERVRDAIEEVIKVLRDFKNRILAMLSKAKSAVDIIVADPIGFLKNVLAAIKLGLSQFVDNIWTHLKAGFMSWLFGSLAETGVEVPSDFSLGSILKLVLQVLGLTYANLRAKAVKLLGERAVGVIEQVAKFIWTLITEGPAKLWEMIKEYLGNLKDMIIDAIQDWVVTTVIKAAVTKLVSMFNPVGAIIQAILTIYNVVMFLIERINQILAFVESVVNSVYDIATGAIGNAANWIEKALARTVPIIIAFLARLLGITGITEKIVGIVKKVQSKVDQALDKVIGKIAAGIGKFIGGVKAGVQAVAEWWKQKKPFKTKRGESHEVYFTGDPKNLTTMVASKDPRPINSWLDQFTKDSEKLEDDQESKARALIATVRTAAKANQDDPAVVDGMKKLFDLFEGVSTETKKTIYDETKGADQLEGHTVGTSMSIDWLNQDWYKRRGSKVEKKEQDFWGKKLLLHGDAGNKYVCGHLLNHNLGGEGVAANLFPITAYANGEHLRSTESRVKTWLSKKSRWARYEVKVNKGAVKLDSTDVTENYVSCTFNCRVVLRKSDGDEKESFVTSIPSQATTVKAQRPKAAVFKLT